MPKHFMFIVDEKETAKLTSSEDDEDCAAGKVLNVEHSNVIIVLFHNFIDS